MSYELLVLDLDGTLTNSKKEITEPTKRALLEIQADGKKVVLASGRPEQGVLPLAKELQLEKYGSYILSYNGGRIRQCKTQEIIYNKLLPNRVVKPIYEIVKKYPRVDLATYKNDTILSGLTSTKYTELESFINHMPIVHQPDFGNAIDFPINKLLVTGEPIDVAPILKELQDTFHGYLNIYNSDPWFIEIMPQNIDKGNSLKKLLLSLNLTVNEMICCGDGFNDLSMIECAGLGVAMENAQSALKEIADYITKSNDNDGVLHVINEFMRD
ncbi:haloacid dehalogenase [Mediterraneibacter butyricigenes]|uniref:Haloacid dehalogenase n=1 Tax=Mediterraneibacter butyricigenes TaxID=2316025 RepID=A0A391P149_9FIRM|nr:Cof-type HAD-IIB family hydrolase [Mediterraneibacter butyricigenes]RGV97022.1 HAD family phosphatase [Ruminococcus sp. AF14-10]GCA67391.1 haloacid dehalogenase [Mediterraneibacter butyricigenes]